VDERVSLITMIFSDHNEVEMDKDLFGDDAQTFVDMVFEVRAPHYLMPRAMNFLISSIRHWITFL